ncbi:Multidrug resistance operon repressor [bioreactor metagenome]|uniref:Multidrug resistance operon repressor n=1 Tax=bioreactor metagenome TaxID=1076179 RepID=A0A644TZX4_9ZZZZ|nr:MarR family transcriptional regulator [Methanobrevibacter sp.]MEA4956495.1 MarR family transcriptional regulator [Methanobrevibacter sp.]
MEYVFDESDLFYQFMKISHKLRKMIQNKLKCFDISFEQWHMLYFIYQNEGCNQKMLSKASKRDTGAITRSLNTLENKNLIERKSSFQDKREFLIYLTDKSLNLFKETSKLMLQNSQEIKNIFTKNELEMLFYLLDKLDSNL